MNKMPKPRLKVIPLGGLTEIGKNMMVLEYQEDLTAAESNLALSYSEHRKALTNFMRVMGTLIEEKGLTL